MGTEADRVKLVQVSRNGGLSKQFDQNKIKGSAFACELVMQGKKKHEYSRDSLGKLQQESRKQKVLMFSS